MQSDNEEGGKDEVVESPDIHVTPIVKLAAVVVDSGEQDEEPVFETCVCQSSFT